MLGVTQVESMKTVVIGVLKLVLRVERSILEQSHTALLLYIVCILCTRGKHLKCMYIYLKIYLQ